MAKMPTEIQYTDKYEDKWYEYRHVFVPLEIATMIPRTHLLTETEWRNIGIQQSPGWVHYMHHRPEPHVLLFRRLKAAPGAPAPAPNATATAATAQQ